MASALPQKIILKGATTIRIVICLINTLCYSCPFHEKVKIQFPVKADVCFDEVNNDNLYNYNYAN